MTSRATGFSWLLALLPLAVACGGAEGPAEEKGIEAPGASGESIAEIRARNDAAERAAGLVYTLEVTDGHQIKFFRPGNGVLLASEQAPIGNRLLLGAGAEGTPAALFSTFRPGEAVPDVIREFEVGQLVPGATDDTAADGPSGSVVAPSYLVDKHATESGFHFEAEHRMCPRALRDIIRSYPASVTGCWLNVWQFGATWASATHSQAFVGSYGGNNQFAFFYDGSWQLTVTVLQGENRHIVAKSGHNGDKFVSKTHRYDIDGAARHVGVAFVKAPYARSWLTADVAP